tara:strand:- start:2694 stop:2915 length:222 start_codon:yes stop_codon:yes gene_type:complete
MPNLTKSIKKKPKTNLSKLQARTIKFSSKQSGKLKSLERDLQRLALKPGQRRSKTGKLYWETRINRSDLKGNV